MCELAFIARLLRALPSPRPLSAGLAALTATAALGFAAPAAAEPALWVIKDHDSTLYLFGTVHMLRQDTAWKSPKIARAMAAAQDLTLEISDVDPPQAVLVPLIQKYGVDPARPLSSRLTADEKARLDRACALYGLNAAQMEPLRPWLVGLQLSMAPIIKAGFDPSAGVDKLLQAEAVKRGEPIAGFETFEEQIAYFASLPPDVELDFLRQALDDSDTTVADLDRLARAWEAGNVDAIGRVMNDEMREKARALYDLLLVHRNENFARQIKAKLAGHGVSFIAVGAAHLAGPDSVQAQLKKLGVTARRL